jgi:DNA-directed RNA polymerase specialized sigma24 family protein
MYQRHLLYNNERHVLEPADLVQAASVHLLEKFPRARFQENPLAWLCKVAANAMHDQVNGRASLIKREPDRPPIPVLPLDTPLTEQGATLVDLLAYDLLLPASAPPPLFERVAQAVAALPDKQRAVITLHFGLDAHSPIPLRQISREFSPGIRKPCSAEHHYRRALRALRQTLSHEFSQPTRAGGAQ